MCRRVCLCVYVFVSLVLLKVFLKASQWYSLRVLSAIKTVTVLPQLWGELSQRVIDNRARSLTNGAKLTRIEKYLKI